MMYTAPKRVERDGRLVCFEGEVMGDDEAMRRGLIDGPLEDEKPLDALKLDELKALAEEKGIDVGKRPSKAQIIAALSNEEPQEPDENQGEDEE